MTPPLEVPMDSLDQIRPEHMTLSAELPDFEGDQEVMSTRDSPLSPPVVQEEPQVESTVAMEQPHVAEVEAIQKEPTVGRRKARDGPSLDKQHH